MSRRRPAALGKVYCFGPTFRAEKSKTRRHLTEFWMVEPEVAFNDSDANMTLQEELVSYLVARALDRRREELKELERDPAPLERVIAPFPRISYSDAVVRLNALGSDMKWGQDLGGDDETLLAREYDRPVFVFNYPKEVKAFYMKENPDDPRTVLNNDCLAPEGYGEIIGGITARGQLRPPAGADQRAGPRREHLPLVSRPPEVRHLRAFRLRARCRAHGGVDHRTAACARDDRLSAANSPACTRNGEK